jgi:hypothetical protein
MNLMAIGASDIGLSVGSAMPLAQAHRVGVAAKASEGDGFRRGFAETDNFRQVLDFHEVDFAGTMTGFATAFVKGQLGVADIRGVRGAGKTFGEGAMALGALFVTDEVFGLRLGEKVQRKRWRFLLILARHERQRPKERQHHRTKTPPSHVHASFAATYGTGTFVSKSTVAFSSGKSRRGLCKMRMTASPFAP